MLVPRAIRAISGRGLLLAVLWLVCLGPSEVRAQPRTVTGTPSVDRAKLLASLKEEGRPRGRERLAEMYAADGYCGPATFFELHPGSARLEGLDACDTIWLCDESPVELADLRRVAEGIALKRKQGKYEEALRDSARQLERRETCLIRMEWAASVVSLGVVGSTVNSTDVETAIRLLLMSVADLNVKPTNASSRASVLDLLAGYFASQKDWISTHVALELEKGAMALDRGLPTDAHGEAWSRDLDRRLSVVEDEIRRQGTPP